MDFKDFSMQAIQLFFFQNAHSSILQKDRPAFANELFIKLENALTEDDKKMGTYFFSAKKGETENGVSNFFLLDEFIQDFENEITFKLYDYVDMMNKQFLATDEIKKQDCQKKCEQLKKQINDYLNEILTSANAKNYCVYIYGKLWNMSRSKAINIKHKTKNPQTRIECLTSYLSFTEKIIIKVIDLFSSDSDKILEIANLLKMGFIQKVNDIYNNSIKEQRPTTYPNHAHKMDKTPYELKPSPFKPSTAIVVLFPDLKDENSITAGCIPLYEPIVLTLKGFYKNIKSINPPTTPTGGKGIDNKTLILQRWRNALYDASSNIQIACLFIESGLYQHLLEKQSKLKNENLLNPGPLAKEMCKYIFKKNHATYKTILSNINNTENKNSPSKQEYKQKANELITKHQLKKIRLIDIPPSED